MTLAEMAQRMIERGLAPLDEIEERVGKLYLTGYISLDDFVALHELLALAAAPTEAPVEAPEE